MVIPSCGWFLCWCCGDLITRLSPDTLDRCKKIIIALQILCIIISGYQVFIHWFTQKSKYFISCDGRDTYTEYFGILCITLYFSSFIFMPLIQTLLHKIIGCCTCCSAIILSFSYMVHSKPQSKTYFQRQYQCQYWSCNSIYVNLLMQIVSPPNIILETVGLLGDNLIYLGLLIFQKNHTRY